MLSADALLPLAAAALGAGLALLVGTNALPLGQWLGLIDHPDGEGGRKRHKQPTPLVGGFGIMAALLAAGLLASLVLRPDESRLLIGWLLLAVLGMFLLGAADDRRHLGVAIRLGVASFIFVAISLAIPTFRIEALLFSGQEAAIPLAGFAGLGFTLLCLVGFLNAVNMADGKNGLVIGQAIIWTLFLGLRADTTFLPLLLAVGASLCVLLAFNMHNKLFLGDSGSYALSTFFGLAAIAVWNRAGLAMRADDVALLFAIPVFDTLRLMVQRTVAGRTPFTPGRDHLHHYLDQRWAWPRPLPAVLLLVFLPNLAAFLWPGTAWLWLVASFLAYGLLLLVATRQPHAGQSVPVRVRRED